MIGIIGGSGLEDPKILKDAIEKTIDTPYGSPSSKITVGSIEGIDIAILSRHGKDHSIYPTGVNSRANIHALKSIGVTHILATSACGSLKEEIKPGDFVVVDQFIDRTTKRPSTFYDKDKVCHIPMADPFCEKLRDILIDSAKKLNLVVHDNGTVVTVEGPRFGTRAESNMLRMFGGDVVNMSTVPECVLAREAGICYAVVCMSTDYDCWKESGAVNIEMVLKTFKDNAAKVKELLINAIPNINHESCSCMEDYKTAIMG